MMEGAIMANTEAIEKAKEHFGKIVEEQLQRIERMKAGDEWVDYSKLKPIIIGVRGFAEKFVLKANAGLAIEPENEKELVDAVVNLADNPNLIVQYGQSGYQFVINGYTRNKLAGDYLKVIENVVNGTIPSNVMANPVESPAAIKCEDL